MDADLRERPGRAPSDGVAVRTAEDSCSGMLSLTAYLQRWALRGQDGSSA